MAPVQDATGNAGHWMRFVDYPWRPEDRDVFFGGSEFHALVQPENPLLQRLCYLASQNEAVPVAG